MGNNTTPYPVPLTKREQFTLAAMQGFCASLFLDEEETLPNGIAKKAVATADATMEALGIKEEEMPEPVNDQYGH